MRIVIIGNGISGVTAALRIRHHIPEAEIVMISGESDYFYSRPALMYIFMGHMTFEDTKPFEDWHWDKARITRVRDWVTHIDTNNKTVTLKNAEAMSFDKLIIATGSVTNKFGWPGQDLKRVSGMVNLMDLEDLQNSIPQIKNAVIIGGGLIGIELAEMLHSRGVHVTLLARESSYWLNALPDAESKMINRVITKEQLDLRLEDELSEIIDDGQGGAAAIVTKKGERIDCQFVGLTTGVRPNLSALEGSGIQSDRGVLVDFSFRTNIPDVFAIGDCAEFKTPEGQRNRVEQLWYTGKMHGEVVADVISGAQRTYDRGIWYNSAKFIDLEWQTYGQVPPGLRESAPNGEKQLYWEHDDGLRGVRIVCDGDAVVGFNTMGIRYKHRVCERWIAEKRTIDYVLDNLMEANFDPEFFRQYEQHIIGAFKEQL